MQLQDNALQFIIDKIFVKTKAKDKVSIVINHDCLDNPILIPYMFREQLTPEVVMTRIAQVCQSQKELRLNETMTIFASTIESVIGGSNRLQKYLNQKKYSVKIMNNDNLCALYAIVIGMKFADKEFLKKKNNLTQIEQSELQILKSDINTLLRKGKLLVNKTETLVQKLNLANSHLVFLRFKKLKNL